MVRRRFEHRGVRFSLRYNTAGYAWHEVPEGIAAMNNPHNWHAVPLDFGPARREVLAPVEWAEFGESLGIYDIMHSRGTTVMSGLDIARKAYNRFHQLAETITLYETVAESPREMYDDTRAWSERDGVVRVLTTDAGECRRLIAEYANQFGTLWGDNDPRGLDAWTHEAVHFLTLRDIARAVRPGADTRAFEACIRLEQSYSDWYPSNAPPNALRYHGERPFSEILTLATAGEISESELGTTDRFSYATTASPHQRARMLLHREVNRRLWSGMDFWIDPMDARDAMIVPHHLGHLLYLRLWMDTVDGTDLEQVRTCLHCGRELPREATRRRKYCDNDDQCRTAYHNRRRAGN